MIPVGYNLLPVQFDWRQMLTNSYLKRFLIGNLEFFKIILRENDQRAILNKCMRFIKKLVMKG